MQRLIMAGLTALALTGTAHAQTASSGAATGIGHRMPETQKTKSHSKPSKHPGGPGNAGAEPGTNVSGTTTSK